MRMRTEMQILDTAYIAYRKGNGASLVWLNDFYDEYKRAAWRKHDTDPDGFSEFDGNKYIGYISYLLDVKRYFIEGNYAMVANSIHKMAYFVDLFRAGVYDNLANILEEYLRQEESKT